MKPRWSSTDGRFQVHFEARSLAELDSHCRNGWPDETGGVLVGAYSMDHTTADVTLAAGPPPDSHHGPTRFHRGTAGLRRLLQRLWSRPRDHRTYYLGEWHLHPDAAPTPSRTDLAQMRTIAEGPHSCPEPILVIVGGRPGRWRLSVLVVPRRGAPVQLFSD